MTPDYLKGSIVVSPQENSFSEKTPDYLKGSKSVQGKQKESLWQGLKELVTSPEETPFEHGLGVVGRGAASTALGFPGEFAQLIKGAGKSVASLLGLPTMKSEEEFKLLPTTSDVEKGIDIATEGRFAPTEEERPAYEVAQGITGLFLPGSKAIKPLAKIGIPIASQMAKEGLKEFGAGETTQELAKLGVNIGLSVANIANGRKYASDLMRQAESLMPQGQMIDANPITAKIQNITAKPWYKGANLPSTRPAKSLIGAIEKNIAQGQMEGHVAMELRKNANEMLKNLSAFEIYSKADKKKAIRLVGEVKDAILDGLEHYGNTIDPVFGQASKEANHAYATLAKSEVIKNFIEKHVPALKSNWTKSIVGLTTAVGEAGIAKYAGAKPAVLVAGAVGAATVAGAGTLKTGQILYRILQDPKLRFHYTQALIEASKGNAAQTTKQLRILDEKLFKLENDKSTQSEKSTSAK